MSLVIFHVKSLEKQIGKRFCYTEEQI
jgi:hypothetical protein